MTEWHGTPWEFPRWTGEREFRRAQAILRTAARHALQYTPAARLVIEETADYINFVCGYAYPGQRLLAKDLGLNERTVRQAMAAVNGHLFQVQLVGRNYRYYPIWGAVGIIPGTWPTAAKNSAFEIKKPENSYRNSGKKLQKTAEKNSPLSYLSNLQSDLGPADREICAVADAGWLSVKKNLRSRFGSDEEASWFGRLALENWPANDGEIVLAAPTPFLRSEIEKRYGQAIAEACHAARPGTQPARLRFVVLQQRAAE